MYETSVSTLAGFSLRAGYWANQMALRMIFPPGFPYGEVQFKLFSPHAKIIYTTAESSKETPAPNYESDASSS